MFKLKTSIILSAVILLVINITSTTLKGKRCSLLCLFILFSWRCLLSTRIQVIGRLSLHAHYVAFETLVLTSAASPTWVRVRCTRHVYLQWYDLVLRTEFSVGLVTTLNKQSSRAALPNEDMTPGSLVSIRSILWLFSALKLAQFLLIALRAASARTLFRYISLPRRLLVYLQSTCDCAMYSPLPRPSRLTDHPNCKLQDWGLGCGAYKADGEIHFLGSR